MICIKLQVDCFKSYAIVVNKLLFYTRFVVVVVVVGMNAVVACEIIVDHY